MKLKLDKENLEYGLATVYRAVATKPVMQELSGVEVVADNQQLHLRSTNLEIEISCNIPAVIEEPGSALVPAKTLLELTKKLPKGDVSIIATGSEAITVKYGRNRTQISTYSASLPTITKNKKDINSFIMNANDFYNALNKVLPAVSKENSRVIFTGVYLKSQNGKLLFAATDVHRLAVKEIAVNNMPEFSIIIPEKAAIELLRIRNDCKEIKVELADNNICFKLDNIEVITRLIEGVYPDIMSVIPREVITECNINKHDLLTLTERCSLLATRNVVRVNVNGAIEMFAESDLGSCNETIEVEKKGEDLEVNFNPHLLLEGLKVIESKKVNLQFAGVLKPIILRDPNESNYLYMFLPLRAN